MRIKSVSGLNGNEVLAEPILTNENVVLIPKGTVLKEEYIPLIQSLEIETLMVEDPYEDMENPNTIIDRTSLDQIIERVKKIMENHIYHSNKSLREFEMIANEIVKVMNDMPMDLVIDMDERTANLYEHTVMVTLLAINVARNWKWIEISSTISRWDVFFMILAFGISRQSMEIRTGTKLTR